MAMMTASEMKGLSVMMFKAFLFQMSYKINYIKTLNLKEKLIILFTQLNKIINKIIIIFSYFCVYKYLETIFKKKAIIIILFYYILKTQILNFKTITINNK